MNTPLQTTLRRAATLTGIGLHTGRPVTMTLRAGRAGTGIVFVRRGAPKAARFIRADWRAVASSRLATVLGNGHGTAAGTVEHLMAALRGCGVDNAFVVLDGDEVPIADGSALPFVRLVRQAGIATLPVPRRSIRVLAPVEVREGDSLVRLEPGDGARFTVGIDFASRAIGRQEFSFDLAGGDFERDVAPARTFGFQEQLDSLRAQGLARGGSTDTAIVIAGDEVLNPGGLRFADEFARHKLLDSIGDLYLAGAPLIGHYTGFRPGHALNVALLAALFATPGAWCEVAGRVEPAGEASGRVAAGPLSWWRGPVRAAAPAAVPVPLDYSALVANLSSLR